MKFKDIDKSIKKKLDSKKHNLRCILKNNDHHRYSIHYKGKKICRFKTSHGDSKEVGNRLKAVMARQLGIKKQEFEQLIACPLKTEKFIKVTKLI